MNNSKRYKDRHGRIYDMAAASVIGLLFFFVSFAGYTYQSTHYTLTGWNFLFGKSIAGGSVYVKPNTLLLITAIALVLMALLGFFFQIFKNRVKIGARLFALFSLIGIAMAAILSAQISTLLDGARNVSTKIGVYLVIIACIYILVRALYILYLEKSLSALDFMLIPGLLYLFVNSYIPMAGISIAFMRLDFVKGIFHSPFVGLTNFKYIFTTKDLFLVTRNTLLYNIAFIITGMVSGVIVAICLFCITRKALQKFYQSSILLPQVISMVIVSYIVFAFLGNTNGFINNTLLSGDKINFYSSKGYWPFILIIVNNWKGLGYNAIIYLSSLCSIDTALFDAATVDGASVWKQIRKIILPMLKPTLITLLILNCGHIMTSSFELFYQVPMNSSSLFETTSTLDTYVYRALMVLNNISVSSAMSAIQSVVGFLLVLLVNWIVRRVERESAMF
jgi:ABC-type polysaccharide transport system permease subunit